MFGRLRKRLALSQHTMNTVRPQKALESIHYSTSVFLYGERHGGHIHCILAKAGKRLVNLKTQQAVDFAHDV